jgi:hypothetical protein
MSQNRTRKPSPEDKAYVLDLIERLGTCSAARKLKLSRLAVLNVAHGGDCYQSTLAHVTACRLGAVTAA